MQVATALCTLSQGGACRATRVRGLILSLCASRRSLACGAVSGGSCQHRCRRDGGGALEAERVDAEAGGKRCVAGDEHEADERCRRGRLERAGGGQVGTAALKSGSSGSEARTFEGSRHMRLWGLIVGPQA